jgi:hypothetical protein
MSVRGSIVAGVAALCALAGGLVFSAAAFAAPEAPVSEAASAIARTEATLNGELNPNTEAEVGYEFAYNSGGTCTGGATTAPGGEAEVQAQQVSTRVSGLEPNREYTFCVVATHQEGATLETAFGAPISFLTLPEPPTVTTGEASAVGPYSATVAGSVEPGSSGANSDTLYYFQYGPDRSYESQAPLVAGDAGQGTSPVPEQTTLTGLEPGTTYYYRIVASNDNTYKDGGYAPQVVYGEAGSFTTLATPPVLSGLSVSGVTQSAATLEAKLEGQELLTHWELRLGNTQGSLQFQAAGDTSGAGVAPLAVGVQSLSPGTVYYYRFIATNTNGSGESPEGSFTTSPAAGGGSSGQVAVPLLALPAGVAFPAEEAVITAPVSVRTTKALTRAQKLTRALRACGSKPKSRRASCKRKARARYGPTRKR